MKENKYDTEIFFNKYSEMERSKKGLEGAGEWYAFKQLLPEMQDKTVLDLGCGYGWHCKYASEHGAKSILGTDISNKMLTRARQINAAENITYIQSAMEDLKLEEQSFDIVLSSLAFHYIQDIQPIFTNIHTWLKKEGSFIFSVEHPVFTAKGNQDWYYDKNGNILHFPVDNYYYEGKRDAMFLGEHVTKYHRTLTTYLSTILNLGFSIEHVIEPAPQESMFDIPGMKDEMRRPMMLLIAAKKK